jgi:hypothetical protein
MTIRAAIMIGLLLVCSVAVKAQSADPKTTAVSRQVDAEAAQERRVFWHYMERCR